MNKIFNLDFTMFKELIKDEEIDDNQLLIIYCVIQNNRYALINRHYHNVIYNYIEEKTSIATCLKFKNFILTNYFKLELNV